MTHEALIEEAWSAASAPRAARLVDARFGSPLVLRSAAGAAAVFSDRSPDKETANEDALAVVEPWPGALVVVVADGLGGHALGDTASRIAVESVVGAVLQRAESRDEPSLRAAVLDGVEQSHDEILSLATGAATTLAVVEVVDGVARAYHVGDAVAMVFGQRGRRKLETISHSPVGYAVEAGMLDAAEAMRHEDRHLVSNCVGLAGMRIEVGEPIRLARYDTLLVASDGLVDNLATDEVVSALRTGKLAVVCRGMAEKARRRMRTPDGATPSKPDDLTFAAFRLSAR